MKRVCLIGFLFLLLFGCGKSSTGMDRILALRTDLQQCAGCAFTAEITADYSQLTYAFKMRCKCDKSGNITFEVIAPDSVSGITGTLDVDGGNLTFDDHALLFSMLADGRLSPVSAPWVMMQALRSGYISGCAEDGDGLLVHIDDSYQQDPLQVILRTDSGSRPVSAEIYYRGNRILAVVVEDFLIL